MAAHPAIGLPVGVFGKGLNFALQFIKQRDFDKINNHVSTFLKRREVDTFIYAFSCAAAWSMEEKWQWKKLPGATFEMEEGYHKMGGGLSRHLLGRLPKRAKISLTLQ